jgi:hypothetical protein
MSSRVGPPRPEDTGFVDPFNPIVDVVKRDQPLAAGGTVLGFEPLVANGGLACSWLCNGLARDAAEKLGVQTNPHGLIENLEDAARVVTYIRKDGHAEPGLWLPWLLVPYDAPSQTMGNTKAYAGGCLAATEHQTPFPVRPLPRPSPTSSPTWPWRSVALRDPV